MPLVFVLSTLNVSSLASMKIEFDEPTQSEQMGVGRTCLPSTGAFLSSRCEGVARMCECSCSRWAYLSGFLPPWCWTLLSCINSLPVDLCQPHSSNQRGPQETYTMLCRGFLVVRKVSVPPTGPGRIHGSESQRSSCWSAHVGPLLNRLFFMTSVAVRSMLKVSSFAAGALVKQAGTVHSNGSVLQYII